MLVFLFRRTGCEMRSVRGTNEKFRRASFVERWRFTFHVSRFFPGSAVPQQREGKEHGGRADAVAAHGEEARHLAVQRRPVSVAAAPGHVEENQFGLGTPSERQRSVPIDHHHPPSARYSLQPLLFFHNSNILLFFYDNTFFSKKKDPRLLTRKPDVFCFWGFIRRRSGNDYFEIIYDFMIKNEKMKMKMKVKWKNVEFIFVPFVWGLIKIYLIILNISKVRGFRN